MAPSKRCGHGSRGHQESSIANGTHRPVVSPHPEEVGPLEFQQVRDFIKHLGYFAVFMRIHDFLSRPASFSVFESEAQRCHVYPFSSSHCVA